MLSFKSLQKLIDIYKTYKFEPSLINQKEDISEIINILLEMPFFKEIRKTKGYITLKNIVNNMYIKLFPQNSLVYLNNEKEHKCYILLFGLTKEEEIKTDKNRCFLGKSYKCISNCYYAMFDSLFYINNILRNSEIFKRKFIETINNFKIFSNFSNHYIKLFLNYDEKYYSQNEIVYKENDKVNGIYIILEGEFQLYKKIKPKSLKNIIKKNNEEINNLKKKSQLFHRIIFGEGQKVLQDKQKIIEETINPKEKSTNIRFYLNKSPYSLLKLKVGDMFGDLEIIRKLKERKFSVMATGLKNIIWFFPKNIIEDILIKIDNNNTYFQKLSNYKYDILKKQYNKTKIIDNIRRNFNINNIIDYPKTERTEESKINNTNNTLILNTTKIKINKNMLENSKTIKKESFNFITQKYRGFENLFQKYINNSKYKYKFNSSLDIRKKKLKYNKINDQFMYHNFSNDNDSSNRETFLLLSENKIFKKKLGEYKCRRFSTLKKNKEKIKFFKSNKDISSLNNNINDLYKKINVNNNKKPISFDKDKRKKNNLLLSRIIFD